ncbi:MAG: macro domain-containing protein [Thermoleophilia bacterium]|nr:macro domain-containing protein [Thermoleophilia bacterium]
MPPWENYPVDISVFEGDITLLAVDAIANAANGALWMGSGVAGAIKRAGGEEIEREAVAQGPIEPGEAVATSAGALPARWVVHGAAMGPDLVTSEELIRRTTRSCLRVADGLGARTLALPAFGTGVGAFPLDTAAKLMVDVVTAYEAESLEGVVFAVYGDAARDAFERALAQ